MASTPLRNVRVADDLWGRALERAEQDGTTVSAVIVDRLQQYVDSDREVVDDAADEVPTA